MQGSDAWVQRTESSKYLLVTIVIASLGLMGVDLLPTGRGDGGSGWYQILDVEGETVVQVLAGEDLISRVGKADGRTIFRITGNLTGTLRIFSSNVTVEGGPGEEWILGQIDVWADADNIMLRNMTFSGAKGASGISLSMETSITEPVTEVVGRVITNCTFLDGAGIGGQNTYAFVISNNVFVGKGFELLPNGTVRGEHPDEEPYAAIKLSGPWGWLGARLICGNRIVGYRRGIDLQWVDGIMINGNEITHAKETAISLVNSYRSVISGNVIRDGGEMTRLDGIAINAIWENDPMTEPASLAGADWGTWIWGNLIWSATDPGYYGLRLTRADNATVVNNNFMGDGRYLSVGNSANCRWNAGYYSLDLPEEELQAILLWAGLLGRWPGVCAETLPLPPESYSPEDVIRGIGSIRGGNYWQAHSSPDVKQGPNQDRDGADGICDLPYKATTGATDLYPLSVPFAPPADWDGVPDSLEALVQGPGGEAGDGNSDGMDDSRQEDVASLPLHQEAERQGYATLAVSTGELANVKTLPAPADPPAGVSFLYGMFSFEVWNIGEGEAVSIDVFVPGDEPSLELWKKNISGAWNRIEIAASQVAPPANPPVTKVSFSLLEGGPFDHDGIVDGRLVDDAGLVIVQEGSTMLALALLGSVCLLGGFHRGLGT